MITRRLIKKIDEIRDVLQKKADKKDYLNIISSLWEQSIQRNLDEGGRWDGNSNSITIFSGGKRKWVPLSDNTKKNYMIKGYGNLKPTLNRTRTMLSTMEVVPKSGKIFATVKSPYASIHQFGGKINHPGGTPYGFNTVQDMKEGKIKFLKKGSGFMVLGETKPHIIEIPARPYIVIQDEDIQEWMDIIKNDILE